MTQRCFHCFKRINVSEGTHADNMKRLRALGWREVRLLGVKRWFCPLHVADYESAADG